MDGGGFWLPRVMTQSTLIYGKFSTYKNRRSSTKDCRKRCDANNKKDVIKAAGCLQLRTGTEAGRKAAIHTMHEIFDDIRDEVILLVDA